MDVTVICTVIGTGVAIVGILGTLGYYAISEIHRVEDRLERKTDVISARTDQLYMMFIEALQKK
jgi:hypothetical protein